MAFISDGQRTWDSGREYELVSLGGGFEGVYRFHLISPSGKLYFDAEWNPYVVNPADRVNNPDNPNADNIVEWDVNLGGFLPGLNEGNTKSIIREAMKSYVWQHGADALRGYPCREVICRFSGKYGDTRMPRRDRAQDWPRFWSRFWKSVKKSSG
jgi:hypothetical protein